MVGFRGLDWIYRVATHETSVAARARQFKQRIALATSPRGGNCPDESPAPLRCAETAVRPSRRSGCEAQRSRVAKSSATGILNPIKTRDTNSPLTL